MRSDKPRVLWVDDQPFALDYYCRLLADIGILVDLETDVKRAADRLRSERYELVLLDLLLPPDRSEPDHHPTASSLRLLDEIRVRGSDAPPVVVVTALVDSGVLDEAHAKGVQDVLHKPVDFDSIQRIVKRYVGWPQQDSDW